MSPATTRRPPDLAAACALLAAADVRLPRNVYSEKAALSGVAGTLHQNLNTP